MSGLVEWLSARLDEDEAVIRAATAGTQGLTLTYNHVEVWSADQALAEVAAKRRIVELFNHSAVTGLQNRVEHGEVVTTEFVKCACGWKQDVLSYQDWEDLYGAHLAELGLPSQPHDQVLWLLALPYAGRDGWREEWRPQ